MKVVVILLTILPNILVVLIAFVGHLWLCLWHWKRPLLAFWRDSVYIYQRFLQEIDYFENK